MNMERPPPSPPSPPTAPMAPPAPSPAMFGHIYRLRGWSVFPLPPGQKAPARPWKQFQTYRPSGHVIDTWFRQRPDSGIAVVTGTVSNLVVLDVDSAKHPDAAQAVADRCGGVLPVAPMVRTGSGGLHLYFSHPGGIVRNRVSVLPGVDLRGDGGFAVAPPSTHPCGQPYEWIADTAQLSPPPAWLISETAPRLFLVSHHGPVAHPCIMKIGYHRASRGSGNVAAPWYRRVRR